MISTKYENIFEKHTNCSGKFKSKVNCYIFRDYKLHWIKNQFLSWKIPGSEYLDILWSGVAAVRPLSEEMILAFDILANGNKQNTQDPFCDIQWQWICRTMKPVIKLMKMRSFYNNRISDHFYALIFDQSTMYL